MFVCSCILLCFLVLFCVIQVIVGALISFSLLTSRLNYLSVSLMSLFVPRPILEYLSHPPLPQEIVLISSKCLLVLILPNEGKRWVCKCNYIAAH